MAEPGEGSALGWAGDTPAGVPGSGCDLHRTTLLAEKVSSTQLFWSHPQLSLRVKARCKIMVQKIHLYMFAVYLHLYQCSTNITWGGWRGGRNKQMRSQMPNVMF